MINTKAKLALVLGSFLVLAVAGIVLTAHHKPSETVEILDAVTVERTSETLAPPITAAPVTTTVVTPTTPAPVKAAPVAHRQKAVITTSTTVQGEDFPSPLQVAQLEVGKRGSYTEGGFWCARFVSWTGEQAGLKDFKSADGPAELWRQAMEDNRVHPLPQVGDMGFTDLRAPSERSSELDIQVLHVFIVESVEGNVVHTIEGNVAGSDVVARNTRSVDDGMVIAFASFPG